MRFNLLLVDVLLEGTVFDEFPQTFWLVLIDNVGSHIVGGLYRWPLGNEPPTLLRLVNFRPVLYIQGDHLPALGEVHETIRWRVVNLQRIIIVHFVIFIFEGPWGQDLEYHKRRKCLRNLNSECPFTSSGCLHHAHKIRFGLDVSENDFWPIFNFLSRFGYEGAF